MALPTLNVTPGSGATINTLPNAPSVTANSVSVALASDHVAVPVSVASLPLAAGAATAAKQPALGTAGTPSVDVLTIQGAPSGMAVAVSAAALPLPAGAATAANQASEIGALASIVAAIQAADAPVTLVNRSGYVSGALSAASVASGGSNYVVGNTITLSGGIVLTVATLSGSAVATVTITTPGVTTTPPSGAVAQSSTSGSGTGATFNLTSFTPLATQAAAVNTSRQYLKIKNESTTLNLGASFAGAATFGALGTETYYPAGDGYEYAASRVPSNALSVIGQSAFQIFTCYEG